MAVTSRVVHETHSVGRTLDLAVPLTGVVEGELLLWWYTHEGGVNLTAVPAGWTQRAKTTIATNTSGWHFTQYLFSKVADAADAAGATHTATLTAAGYQGSVLSAHAGTTGIEAIATTPNPASVIRESDMTMSSPGVVTAGADREVLTLFSITPGSTTGTITPADAGSALVIGWRNTLARETAATAGATPARTATFTNTSVAELSTVVALAPTGGPVEPPPTDEASQVWFGNADSTELLALAGWWNGADIEPVTVGGYWDGTQLLPLASPGGDPRGVVAAIQARLSQAAAGPVPTVGLGSSTMAGKEAGGNALRFFDGLLGLWRADHPSGLGSETAIQASASATFTVNTGPGIHGSNAAESGPSSNTFLTSAERANIAALSPALILCSIGGNDFKLNVTPATYKSNLSAAVDGLLTDTPDALILLIHGHMRGDHPSPTYPWTAYGTAQAEIAAIRPNVMFLDLSDDFAALGAPSPDPNGLMDVDTIHLSAAGHAQMRDLAYVAVA